MDSSYREMKKGYDNMGLEMYSYRATKFGFVPHCCRNHWQNVTLAG
jgi:hypothetical protein